MYCYNYINIYCCYYYVAGCYCYSIYYIVFMVVGCLIKNNLFLYALYYICNDGLQY